MWCVLTQDYKLQLQQDLVIWCVDMFHHRGRGSQWPSLQLDRSTNRQLILLSPVQQQHATYVKMLKHCVPTFTLTEDAITTLIPCFEWKGSHQLRCSRWPAAPTGNAQSRSWWTSRCFWNQRSLSRLRPSDPWNLHFKMEASEILFHLQNMELFISWSTCSINRYDCIIWVTCLVNLAGTSSGMRRKQSGWTCTLSTRCWDQLHWVPGSPVSDHQFQLLGPHEH